MIDPTLQKLRERLMDQMYDLLTVPHMLFRHWRLGRVMRQIQATDKLLKEKST